MDDKVTYRISGISMMLLSFFAATVDASQFLLDLTVVLAPLGMVFGVVGMAIATGWLEFGLKVPVIGGKQWMLRLITTIGGFAVTILPFVNGLPEISTAVGVAIFTSRLEDEENFRKAKAKREEEERTKTAERRLLEDQVANNQLAANDNAGEERAAA